MAPAQSGCGLSKPCFPVAVGLRGRENQPAQVPAASPCAVGPQRPPGKGLNSGPGPKWPDQEQAVLCGP